MVVVAGDGLAECYRILKAVYYLDSDVLEAELGSHPSEVWHAICEGTSILNHALVKRIGNGEKTIIWNTNWIPRDNMLRALHPRFANPPKHIAELINQVEMRWDSEAVVEHMQVMDAREMLNIPLSMYTIED